MAMEMRPYQQEARQAVHEQWEDIDRTLLVLPTGTGKTIVFSKIVEDRVRAGGRALILARRGELLDQAADKLASATRTSLFHRKSGTDLHWQLVSGNGRICADSHERKALKAV